MSNFMSKLVEYLRVLSYSVNLKNPTVRDSGIERIPVLCWMVSQRRNYR